MSLNKSAPLCVLVAAAATVAPQIARAELEEIVVTAQKRAESQQNVPITVTTLTGGDLESNGITNTDDLGLATPGLQMNQGGVANLPFMRGIGSQDGTPAQDNPVSTYVDGVLQSSVTGSAFSFNNVQRIEVLKGPQGTLFGRNTTGGVINVITKDPSQAPVLNVDLSYGNYQKVSGGLYGSTGITKNLAADLAYFGSDQGKGYGDNLANGKEVNKRTGETNLRSKWKWTGETGAATLILGYSKYSDDMGYNRGVPKGSLDFQGLGPPADQWDIRNDTQSYAKFKNSSASLKLEKTIGGIDLLSITAWNKNQLDSFTDNDFSGVYYNNAEVDFYERTATQEFQVQSNNNAKLHWIGGVFFLDQSARGRYTIIGPQLGGGFPGGLNTLQLNGHIDSKSIAGFGEVAYNFTDKTRLTVGARVTHDERKFDGSNVILFGALANPNEGYFDDPNGFLVTVPIPQGPKAKWTEPTWRVVLDHKLADDVMIYGSYNRGFRSGNFITAVGAGPEPQKPFNPEFINAFEAGVKSELLDHRVRLNAAVFYYKVKDLQFQILQGVSTVTQNAAAAKIKGAEVALTWQAADGLTVDLGGSYINGHYEDFPNAISNVPVAPGVNNPVSFDASGKRIGGSPKFTVTGALTYRKQLPSGEYSVTGRVTHNDSYPWEPDGRLVQDAYTLFNASLGWRAPSDKWGVRLTGKNLTNEFYTVTTRSVSGQGDFQAAAAPRTYFVTVDYKFF